jgi:hypothetical protein
VKLPTCLAWRCAKRPTCIRGSPRPMPGTRSSSRIRHRRCRTPCARSAAAARRRTQTPAGHRGRGSRKAPGRLPSFRGLNVHAGNRHQDRRRHTPDHRRRRQLPDRRPPRRLRRHRTGSHAGPAPPSEANTLPGPGTKNSRTHSSDPPGSPPATTPPPRPTTPANEPKARNTTPPSSAWPAPLRRHPRDAPQRNTLRGKSSAGRLTKSIGTPPLPRRKACTSCCHPPRAPSVNPGHNVPQRLLTGRPACSRAGMVRAGRW